MVPSELPGGVKRSSPVRSSRTGMCFDPLTSLEEWKAVGAKIALYSDASAWWLGDWLAFGQAKYGRRYKEGVALTGLEYQTLRNYAVVARRFELSRRRNNLSFQHHAEVCALGDDDQGFWLTLCVENRWSKAELRRQRRAARGRLPPIKSRLADRTALRLMLEPQREQRWREAAKRSHRDLEAWMIQVLDDAACLTPRRRPSREGSRAGASARAKRIAQRAM